MGIKTPRQKPRTFLLSFLYRLQRILPLSHTVKLKLFLNLEWIFNRLSHETSFKVYTPENHPVRQFSKKFLFDNLDPSSSVLDLGCHEGDLSFIIAQKAKQVVGIDYNKNAIELAQKNYKKDNLKFYNREAFEFLNENTTQFDTLILSHILEHLDDPKDFLMRFKGFFKKIYIEVPDFDRYYLNHYRKDLHLDLIYSDIDHISEFDRDELRSLLEECSVKIEKEEYRYGVQKLWCIV
jgi:ubiquinone/menaquinone biosynthesis C-methylase UbiE